MHLLQEAKTYLESIEDQHEFRNFVLADGKLTCEDDCNTLEFVLVEGDVVVNYTCKEDQRVHSFTYALYDCVEDVEDWICNVFMDMYDICVYDDEDF